MSCSFACTPDANHGKLQQTRGNRFASDSSGLLNCTAGPAAPLHWCAALLNCPLLLGRKAAAAA